MKCSGRFLLLAGAVSAAVFASPALADSWGISFGYSGGSRCYSTYYYPSTYVSFQYASPLVYYDCGATTVVYGYDYAPRRSYRSTSYRYCSPRRTVVYSTCEPRRGYRSTKTCYTRRSHYTRKTTVYRRPSYQSYSRRHVVRSPSYSYSRSYRQPVIRYSPRYSHRHHSPRLSHRPHRGHDRGHHRGPRVRVRVRR